MATDSLVGFQLQLGGDWIDYPDAASKQILAAYEAGENKAHFVLGIDGKPHPMYIDFEEMVQHSVTPRIRTQCVSRLTF